MKTLSGQISVPVEGEPLVSVVCPTRNGAAHLETAIKSVLSQDYQRVELIVVDGDSTDGSQRILERYAERLRYVSEPDSGQSDAINKGMALARGEILAWLNADDEYLPGAISAAVEAFRSTGAEIVYGDALAVDGWGRRYGHRINVSAGSAERLVRYKCFIVQPASFWKREVWEGTGPLREDLHYALDYEFFMRAARRFSLAYWPYTFAIERLHTDAKTFQGSRARIDEIRASAMSHGAAGLPGSFAAEAAGVYYSDAIRHLFKGRFRSSRADFREARAFSAPFFRSLTYLTAVTALDGRGLPRLRLLANYVVSRRRGMSEPTHNNPPFRRYRWRRSSAVAVTNPLRKLKAAPVINRFGPKLGVLRQHDPKPLRHEAPMPPQRSDDLPTMTVVTPSFNQAPFLGITIDSVLGQGYPSLEYIVQDGGSTDGSVDVLRGISHPGLQWESMPDGGQAAAINRGHRKGSGDIMAWLNSDDIFLPGTLAYVGAFFASNPHVDVVYSHRVLIDATGNEIGRWLLPGHDPSALEWADYIPQETLFWRRQLWDQVGGLDETFRFAMDWDLLLRFEEAGANVVRLPIFGGGFRVYEDQLTSSAIDTVGANEMRRLRMRCHGRDVSSDEVAKALAPYLAKHVALDRAWKSGVLRL